VTRNFSITGPKPTVRGAELKDVPDLCSLVEEYWQFEGLIGFEKERVGEQLRQLISNEAIGAAWIARQSGTEVGYLLGVYVFSLEHLGMTAEIDEFYVQPEARRTGIGGELLRQAQETFLAAGCTNVSLQIGQENETARGFYLKHGFRLRAGFELFEKDLRI
jgi:ribosomal protein S18 acetylase RimI-like enzyme